MAAVGSTVDRQIIAAPAATGRILRPARPRRRLAVKFTLVVAGLATLAAGAPGPARRPRAAGRETPETYGDLLLTGVGCVTASASVELAGQHVIASAHTGCLPRM